MNEGHVVDIWRIQSHWLLKQQIDHLTGVPICVDSKQTR